MSSLFPDLPPTFAPRHQEVPDGASDSWFTPMKLWQPLDDAHEFTMDPCGHREAPVSQAIARRGGLVWTIGDDGLRQSWDGHFVFCNPPYSNIAPWIRKANFEVHTGCPLVVMLVPAWTDRAWWQQEVEPVRDRGPGPGGVSLRTRFLPGREQFGFPGDPLGETGTTAMFWLVLLTWRRER